MTVSSFTMYIATKTDLLENISEKFTEHVHHICKKCGNTFYAANGEIIVYGL